MKPDRLILFFILSLFFISASPSIANGGSSEKTIERDIRYGIGKRLEKFDWSISGAGGSPNILSELTWSDISAIEFKATMTVKKEKLYYRGSISSAQINGGDNRDSDYNGDNRTLEFSRSDNSGNKGSLWDLSGGVGQIYRRAGYDYALLGGVSAHNQNFRMTDGFQTLCVSGSPLSCTGSTGPFAGLDSSYQTLWIGPWAGIDFHHLSKDKKLSAFASLEMHLAYYYAVADWNLRNDFKHPKSFEHEAYGYGLIYSMGLNYEVSKTISLGWEFDYKRWQASDGTDRTFHSSGVITTQPLNEVNWGSASLLGSLKYSF